LLIFTVVVVGGVVVVVVVVVVVIFDVELVLVATDLLAVGIAVNAVVTKDELDSIRVAVESKARIVSLSDVADI
jgi:hypothetical protein